MKESAGKVLMFVEDNFPNDSRVRDECEFLRENGYEITVICLMRDGQKR